jgi:hypothetical protein
MQFERMAARAHCRSNKFVWSGPPLYQDPDKDAGEEAKFPASEAAARIRLTRDQFGTRRPLGSKEALVVVSVLL